MKMSDQSQQVFDAALGLPETERALLAERLLESLEPELEEITEDELTAELDRRRAEIEQGIVKPIPWSQVRFS
jgi:putative addiction module component (TIGR02574 family)